MRNLPSSFDVAGKVVLITGAGRGIGRGIAEVLAEAGADVALNALTPRYVEKAAREIATASGRRVVPVLADVTRPDDVERAVQQVQRDLGRIDVLINCLGDAIFKSLAPLPDRAVEVLSVEELRSVLDINLTSALLCTRAVAAQMLERRAGKVINVSATTAARGGGEVVAYTTAKTALRGFTRAQALEWAPYNIQVNAIAPGIFPDPISHGEQMVAQLEETARKRVPLKRVGDRREVGFIALYLASSASDYMTGQTLYLDGGASL